MCDLDDIVLLDNGIYGKVANFNEEQIQLLVFKQLNKQLLATSTLKWFDLDLVKEIVKVEVNKYVNNKQTNKLLRPIAEYTCVELIDEINNQQADQQTDLPDCVAIEPSKRDLALIALHPASDPAQHFCRDEQFDKLFIALESAIQARTGTCVYISGTPGTGKTSTVREVIGQLDLRVREKELNEFQFVEINGMKLAHPNDAYMHLYQLLNRGNMAASNAMTALESCFNSNESVKKRGVIVVLLDELDQLITKGQQLMYNFFNWPSLPHSRLIVIAIANVMDLPERLLSNKISSRVGLTRVQFTGYTHEELKSIIQQRLEPDFVDLIEHDAVDYATRKVASVGGDARRALSLIQQSITRNHKNGPVKLEDMRQVINETNVQPLPLFLKSLSLSTKVLLSAVLMRVKRSDNIECPLHEVLIQARQLALSSPNKNVNKLFGSGHRLKMFRNGVNELVESGVLVQQAMAGEATQNVRLMVPVNLVRDALGGDKELVGIV